MRSRRSPCGRSRGNGLTRLDRVTRVLIRWGIWLNSMHSLGSTPLLSSPSMLWKNRWCRSRKEARAPVGKATDWQGRGERAWTVMEVAEQERWSPLSDSESLPPSPVHFTPFLLSLRARTAFLAFGNVYNPGWCRFAGNRGHDTSRHPGPWYGSPAKLLALWCSNPKPSACPAPCVFLCD